MYGRPIDKKNHHRHAGYNKITYLFFHYTSRTEVQNGPSTVGIIHPKTWLMPTTMSSMVTRPYNEQP